MAAQLEVPGVSDARIVELWLHGRPAHTRRAYSGDVAQLLGSGKALAAVSLADLQQFADSLGNLAPASRYRRLSAVKSLLAFAHRLGYLPFDAGAALRLPAVRNRLAERILGEDEVREMIRQETDPRNHAILTLLYSTGLRVSEICALCWRDLRPGPQGGQITVFGKGGKTRAILLPSAVWSELAALRPASVPASTPVFAGAGRQGRELKPLTIYRIVRAAARRAGIDEAVSPHWLRHAHASHALDHGAPIHLVQATLGHSSIATTGRYLHARPQESSSKYIRL